MRPPAHQLEVQTRKEIRTLTESDATLALAGRRILVAEQDPHVAEDIARAIERYGGQVVGPLSSVAAALKTLGRRRLDAAVIDIRLADGTAGAILDLLRPAGSVVVIQTDGEVPAEIAARHPDIPVFSKPTPTGRLFDRLVGSLDP